MEGEHTVLMSPKDIYSVEITDRKIVKDFIETHHYSGSINGVKSTYCFRMIDLEGDTVGAALFGAMAMSGQYKRFVNHESEVVELRRLCCTDEAVRNCESFMIGKMLKWLRDNTEIKVVVSYADQEYDHVGTIYKASNFNYDGFRKGARVIVWNGKRYHDKTIRTKYNGKLKPFASRVKEALENGEATYHKTAGKHCFVYRIKRK